MKKNMDQKINDTERIGDSLEEGSPKLESDWGFFAGDDGPVAGQGHGMFSWLRSRPECLNFIRDELLYSYSDAFGSEILEYTDDIQEAIDSIKENGTLFDCIDKINSTLGSIINIPWIGSFKDLAYGDHSFAVKVREDFYELEDEEYNLEHPEKEKTPKRPIDRENIKAFIEFLNEYGC
jgi:hypothetical protein